MHLQRCSVCDPAQIFFTSKFSCLVFCNTTNKIEIGTSNRWGNHLHQSLWWANQKHWAAVMSYLLHSFLEVHTIYQPSQTVQLYWAKTMFLSQTSMFFFLKIIPFYVQDNSWATLEMLLVPNFQRGHSGVFGRCVRFFSTLSLVFKSISLIFGMYIMFNEALGWEHY